MNTIRTKLWTFIMLVVAAVLLMVWLFQIVFLEEYYIRQRANSLQGSVEQIAKLLEDEGYPYHVAEQAQQNLTLVMLTTNCVAALINPDGGITWRWTDDSSLKEMESFNIMLAPFWQKMIEGKAFVYTAQRSDRLRTNSSIAVAVGEPFKGADQGRYYLCLITFMEPIQNTTWLLRRQLTMITLISIGIATLLVFWLSRYITHPYWKSPVRPTGSQPGTTTPGSGTRPTTRLGCWPTP